MERENDRSGEMMPSFDVRVDALRRLSTERVGHLRRELSEKLTALLIEAPEVSAEMTLAVDLDGIVDARVSFVGPEAVEIGEAFAGDVRQIGDVDCGGGTSAAVAEVNEWAVVPVEASGRLGFVVDGSSTVSSEWQPSAALNASALAAELSMLTDCGLRVEVRVAAGDSDRFLTRLTAIAAGPTPPVRLRSAVRRHFPGLVIDADGARREEWLTVDADELVAVVAIPVGGPEPVAGFYTAAAAPIPVGPVRSEQSVSDLRIGQALTAIGRAVPVSLPMKERLRHIEVVGQTGTGKSSTIAAMVREIARAGEGGIVLDPHGALVDRLVAEVPADAADRMWVIRCGDVANPVPISTLAETDPVRRDIAIADTGAIFQELFDKKESGIVGPRFQERVAMGMRAAIALHGDRASVLDVPRILADDELMAQALRSTTDDRLIAWYANDKVSRRSSEYGDLVSWVNSKFEMLSGTAALRGILGSGWDAIDFASAMDAGRIILVDLSKAQLGESATRLLGYLYLNRVWSGALGRESRELPFTVVVDEAQSLISGSLSSMLAEGRKFGLSVVMAHQYLDQLDEDLRPAVEGNVATTIAFRSAVRDTGSLGVRFGGLVDATTLTTLPDLSAVMVRNSAPAAVPHTVIVDHNDRAGARTGDELSRLCAGVATRTRADIVDPYREGTTAAARGESRFAETAQSPHERGARGRGARPRPPADSGFLQEWIAKRETLRTAADDSSGKSPGAELASAPDDGCVAQTD